LVNDIYIYKFKLFQFELRAIISDFQRNPKSKLIENNIYDYILRSYLIMNIIHISISFNLALQIESPKLY